MSSVLYLCVHLRDFAAQALTRPPEFAGRAVAVLSGTPPLERVFAMNQTARSLGLELGMSRLQAESFAVMVLSRNRQQEDVFFATLMRLVERFSPRVETIAWPQFESCGATLVLDVSGSERLLGDAAQIATTVLHALRAAGYDSSVAASHNASTAVLVARGTVGATAVAPGCEAQTLAPLPLDVLEPGDDQAVTFAARGIHTLGQLAALPRRALVSRIGQSGLALQQQARGESDHFLVPAAEPADVALTESLELEHPVELLEPLLFLLSQMLEQVLQRAARRALAIASVETCLVLDGPNFASSPRREHCRLVRPTLPERDRLTLLKLIQLDLELHPPEAAVIGLRITAQPARPQTAQQGLFAAQAPESGRLEILLARLRKLVGEGRVGSPQLLDSHAPEAFRLTNFEIAQPSSSNPGAPPANALALRMVRPPRAVSVEVRGETPEAVHYEGQRLRLETGSGPWRTSGAWWTHPAWCREEWDVVLSEPAQRCLRLAHDPAASCWYVIGIYD
jgi:protein ImuB